MAVASTNATLLGAFMIFRTWYFAWTQLGALRVFGQPILDGLEGAGGGLVLGLGHVLGGGEHEVEVCGLRLRVRQRLADQGGSFLRLALGGQRERLVSDGPGVGGVGLQDDVELRLARAVVPLPAIEVGGLHPLLGRGLVGGEERGDLGLGDRAVAPAGAGRDELPAGRAIEVAAGVGLHEPLEPLDGGVEVLILERHVGQRPLGSAGEREPVLDLLDRLVLDDRLERLRRLPFGSVAFVQQRLPEQRDLVVGVLAEGRLQVDGGGAGVFVRQRELRIEQVGSGGLFPAGADLGDRRGSAAVLARDVQQGELHERGAGLGVLGEFGQHGAGLVGLLQRDSKQAGASHRQRDPAGVFRQVVGQHLLAAGGVRACEHG